MVCKRSEVLRPGLRVRCLSHQTQRAASRRQLRWPLRVVDHDVRIVRIVPKFEVVARLVLLDVRSLQKQGVMLVLGRLVDDLAGVLQQAQGSQCGCATAPSVRREVTEHPPPQVLGLSNVLHSPVLRLPQDPACRRGAPRRCVSGNSLFGPNLHLFTSNLDKVRRSLDLGAARPTDALVDLFHAGFFPRNVEDGLDLAPLGGDWLAVVRLIVLHLEVSSPLRLADADLHRPGHPVGKEDRLALAVARGATHGLDEAPIIPQEALLVSVQDRHEADFGQVQSFPQEVDAHHDIQVSRLELPQNLRALRRGQIAVKVFALDPLVRLVPLRWR
eukprot:scaffold29_cov251-Pinguiococcus_pyrenoidosus.AAC.16